MAQSMPKGFLVSLHAERQLRQQGKQHAKTAPVPMSAAEVDDEFSVDGALAVSAGGSGLASNQAYQDGDTADPQQFQAPNERKARMKLVLSF